MTDGTATTVAVIAIGRANHGDEAAGLVAADILKRRMPDGVAIVEAPATATGPVRFLQQYDTVFAIHAIRSGGAPGMVHRADSINVDVPARFGHDPDHENLCNVIESARPMIGLRARLWFSTSSASGSRRRRACHLKSRSRRVTLPKRF